MISKMNYGRAMAWCSHCGKDCDTNHDDTINITCCVDCGKVLSEGAYFKSPRRPLQKGNVANYEIIYKKAKVSHTSRHNKVFEIRDALWCPHCLREGGTVHEHTTASICCVDCGKILLVDVYTEKATISRHTLSRKDKKKLKLVMDAKSMRSSQTPAEAVGQLHMKK
nr:transcription factor IIIB 60 kDa subunit isoform X1 [Tanacetum cinerariifolium]GEZ62971.1 transcription factor IIIB 60 kDa subunit isoform X1 [Tanacetum cinerariifolium]